MLKTITTINEIKNHLKDYNMAPVLFEALSDTQTPVRVYQTLSQGKDNSFILESVDNNEKWGRYSFIGINPKLEIVIKDHQAQIKSATNTETARVDDPVRFISYFIEKYKMPKIQNAPKLLGGLVGFFGYDTVRYMETKLTDIPYDDIGLPDCDLFLYDELIAFDHLSGKIIIIENILKDTPVSVEEQYEKACARAAEVYEQTFSSYNVVRSTPSQKEFTLTSNMTKEEFEENVKKAKEHIVNGDIFQIVLSQRFEIDNPPDSFSVYRMLRATNPSPYLFYFKNPDYCIAGASPEMLINVTDSVITTKPIAGTMPRGTTDEEDIRFEKQLLSNEKELAEHTMLVDLGRNDIGKVSEYGSVKVSNLMHIERYSKVMHIVSDVSGKLSKDKNAIDALLSVLPAGTLSGAPKFRAMELIDKFEKTKRCLYGGTVGYLGFDGNIDTCIAIRTVLFRNNKAYIQAGAGIVADSVPENEYNETKNKAMAMINAVTEAAGL
ncbi:MAG: anthranilate synthase component I [Oscillospiraceae bacterium]|nr:anthranilate synthase component I [Oscillospiraceae bacterium]